jgi:hypothetical protein
MSPRFQKLAVLGVVVAAAFALTSLASPGADASSCSTSGGIGTQSTCPVGNPYVNPMKGGRWLPGRIDMGVDLVPTRRVPVRAIGDAKILGSDSRSGWPGAHFIWYRLLDGDHAGNIVYVAEHLTNLVPAGTRVVAGQPIATALPGSPWTEWGWATKSGEPRAAPCYREGMATNSGRQMARFLQSLGARPTLDRPNPGPNRPSGKLC